jgi:Fe-S-cluster-containing hydrogenase component 2
MLSFAKEKCVNCRLCEEVCSFRFTNSIHPSVAAIRIGREEGRWGTPYAMMCNLCEGLGEQKCITACPEESLKLSGGVVIWDVKTCTKCEECVDVCPEKAVAFNYKSGSINICDLCGGKPLCIEWCPEGVISL